MATIYVVEDDNDILEIETFALKNSNYEVKGFTNAKDFYAAVEDKVPSLAVLDVMLPDIDGFSLCKQIRKEHFFPIIMLTAKTEYADKITGLTLGADDYICKPFNPLELAARVKTQLRRYTRYNKADAENFYADE